VQRAFVFAGDDRAVRFGSLLEGKLLRKRDIEIEDGLIPFQARQYMLVSSVDVTSLRSMRAASLVTGQNATSSSSPGASASAAAGCI